MDPFQENWQIASLRLVDSGLVEKGNMTKQQKWMKFIKKKKKFSRTYFIQLGTEHLKQYGYNNSYVGPKI